MKYYLGNGITYMSSSDNSRICGVGTALITPFKADGSLDPDTFERFIEFQIEQGVNFLVPLGTTGETPTLSESEQDEVVRLALRVAGERVPVVAGCTSNNTREAVERGRRFAALGLRHILSACPYYNKPTPGGILEHFRTIHRETGLQIVLYNIPGRTASSATPEMIARLTEEGVIFAVKDATGSISNVQRVCQLTGDALTMLSGDDETTLPLMAVGGRGVISVASNLVPRAMRDWVDTIDRGDYPTARNHLKRLLPLFQACFVESNPIPVKGGAGILGLMEPRYRLPITPPAPETLEAMRRALQPFMS